MCVREREGEGEGERKGAPSEEVVECGAVSRFSLVPLRSAPPPLSAVFPSVLTIYLSIYLSTHLSIHPPTEITRGGAGGQGRREGIYIYIFFSPL